MKTLFAILLFLSPAAYAQSGMSLLEKFNAGEIISGLEWQAMVSGKTITYAIGGFDTYVEQYASNSALIWGEYYDGTCFQGLWEEVGDSLCFYWDGEDPVCSQQVRYNDEIIVMMTENGVPTYNMQTVTGISTKPVTCGPDLFM